MPTFWDHDTRTDVYRRVERLTAEHRPNWGKMSVAQMLAHLNDALRMALGELPTAPKRTPLRFWPIKQVVIYAAPWPKGVPTAPELLARVEAADLIVEQSEFWKIADRLAAKPATDRWPAHPAFGGLTYRAWGVLTYRHADHHLRQFGV